mmetsp:Transcript_51511/g.122493  ORF Transcript_51511/g.122493 Transcript_51511/m.122493 type:complete len:245 (-) Transcript_51511:819-1553(-)
MQVGIGLLEMILPRWSYGEEQCVNAPAHLKGSVLVQLFQPLGQSWLPLLRLCDVLLQQPLNIFPQPCPCHLMIRTPVLRQKRSQRCQHARLVFAEVHVPLSLHAGDAKHEHLALLLQPRWICNVPHNTVEGLQHLMHPSTRSKAHHCSVESEHLRVSCRYLVLCSALRLVTPNFFALRRLAQSCVLIAATASGATHDSLLGLVALLVHSLPCLQQSVDALGELGPHIDDGPADVVQDSLPTVHG